MFPLQLFFRALLPRPRTLLLVLAIVLSAIYAHPAVPVLLALVGLLRWRVAPKVDDTLPRDWRPPADQSHWTGGSATLETPMVWFRGRR